MLTCFSIWQTKTVYREKSAGVSQNITFSQEYAASNRKIYFQNVWRLSIKFSEKILNIVRW